jgi:hypothetical protein
MCNGVCGDNENDGSASKTRFGKSVADPRWTALVVLSSFADQPIDRSVQE